MSCYKVGIGILLWKGEKTRMIVDLTKENLVEFESDIANCFNKKQIKSPIHLYDGNENHILRVFEKVKEEDWICCTWRSHYQCLLKGVPNYIVKEKILNGKSISLCFPGYKIISSAIVGGIMPIATGLAWGEKLNQTKSHIWCFSGDMSAATSTWDECRRFSIAHDLPITWIIEDNGKSVMTPTDDVWKDHHPSIYYRDLCGKDEYYADEKSKVIYYRYDGKYPHAGAGERIQF